MAKNEITVNVKANIEIDKDTAEVCLKMIQHYCNAKGIVIIGERRDDGTTEMHFESGV